MHCTHHLRQTQRPASSETVHPAVEAAKVSVACSQPENPTTNYDGSIQHQMP